MQNMSLREITNAVSGKYFGDPSLLSKSISSVVIDSRKVEKDSLFVALKGANVDGHDFIEKAFSLGALVAIGENDITPPTGHAYIKTTDAGQALKDAAAWYRDHLNIPVIGITGSVGKTSTKETIASVLSCKYRVHKTAGNFNNEIGLPLTVFGIRPEHEVAVLEMGINHFGEMTRLSKVAKPDICVITNIGNCHLEHLIDRDGVLKAKTEMFTFMQKNAKIILNGDDDKLVTVTDVEGKKPVFFGLGENNAYYASAVQNNGLLGSSCKIHMNGESFSVSIPIPGGHAIYNTLAACAVADALGVSKAEMVEGIQKLTPIEGRGQILKNDHYAIFNDCYNANPSSMNASLEVLSYAPGRKVAIVGDMLELGANEAKLHRSCGTTAAEKGIDLLLSVGKLGREMANGARESAPASMQINSFDTLDELLTALPDLLQNEDTILVKASHAMGFDAVIDMLMK